MPGQISWQTVFRPPWTTGGIDALTRGTIARLFDDFESYANDAALQVAWIETGGAGNPTLATGANVVHGAQSLQTIVAGATGTIYRAINNNFFQFPFPGRIRYVAFKGIVTTGTSAIRVRLSDASDATLFREWSFTLGTDVTRDHVIDLNPNNTEGYPDPVTEGATTWNPNLVDRLEFRNLADGSTYRLDDIRFYYEYSLLDALGFGTEAATDDGADGSIQSKLRYLNNLVLQKIGETQQYSKYGHGFILLNYSYTFGLELKSGLLVPTVTEINPGNYTINRIRGGTTTEIVASTAASEAAGFISATYTPLEDNWQLGDQLLVTFSGGFVDKDTDTAETLTANAAAGSTTIMLANAALFQAGQRVRIYDDTPDTEIQTIVSIDDPTHLTVGALANTYTTAANARIVLVERTNLETARLASNVTHEPELYKDLQRWILADYDDFDNADADANTERWDIGYIADSDGGAAGTEGGSANINTTTAGQARVAVDPDATPTRAAYAIKRDETFRSRYYSVIVDADVALSIGYATATYAGLRVSAGDVDDPNNYILIAREGSNTANRIMAHAEFAGVVQTGVSFNTTDNAVAFKIERYGNVWNLFYSLTQYPNWQWVKLTQYEDANGDMTSVTSAYLYAESGGTNDLQSVTVDFDNWKYYIGSGAIDQLLSTSVLGSGTFTASSATVPADTGRTEENNFWNATILMPVTGVVAFQPRIVVSFANAGGVFTMDPEAPFTSAPAVGDEYVLLSFAYPLEPAADGANNSTSAHVVGNKSDAASVAAGTASLVARLRAIEAALSVNAVGGGEFELDGVPDLWDALVDDSSANASITTLTGDRDAAVLERLAAFVNALQVTDAGTVTGFEEDGTGGALWESIIAVKGTFTTSNASVPADTGRTEADNYFNGDIIIPISGAVVRQARLIVDFANAGGVFTLDAENPFTAAPGLVNYVILHFQQPLVPAVDSASNQTAAHVVGNKSDTIPAMNLAPGTDSLVRQAKAILERIGATPADLDDSVLTNLGQRDDTATLDTLGDVTTTSIQAKLRRLLLRFSSDAFSATIQGAARTDVENMLGSIATYFSALGAAWSVQVNGLAARDNLEQVLEDISAVLGADGANVFNPSIGGALRTDLDAALAALGTALGAEYDGTPDIWDTVVTGYDSSAIVANEDGSVLERLEDIDQSLEIQANTSLADYDDFDVADADANTERWDVGYLSGAEGGSANINTTTAGKLRVAVDPDATPTAAGYGVRLAQPFVSKYAQAIVDVDAAFGTPSVSWATVGMRVSPTTFDTNNQVYIQRQNSSGGVLNRLAAGAIFGGANQGEVYFTTTDAVLSFKIERWDNVWRVFYSLTQFPTYSWVLLTQYEDATEAMDSQQSVHLDSYSPGTLDAETAFGDFDNFRLYIGLNGISQEIAGDYDSSVVAADEDGSLAERLEQVQEAVNRGTGTSIAANRSLVDALGSDGTTVADSAVSVLGAIGADNANNAFASTAVVENGDGSVLERLEELRGSTTTGTFTLTAAMGTAEQTVVNYTPLRMGRIAVLLDLATLVTAVEGGTVISRLKFMIDGVNLRTIDRADFLVGTDEVHPTVSGFVVEGASFVRVTLQANSAVSVNRDIPYRIIGAS